MMPACDHAVLRVGTEPQPWGKPPKALRGIQVRVTFQLWAEQLPRSPRRRDTPGAGKAGARRVRPSQKMRQD